MGSVPPDLGAVPPATRVTWRQPWSPAADLRATFERLESGALPPTDPAVRKAQVTGPATLAALGLQDANLADRVASAAVQLWASFPGLEELWFDEPCLTDATVPELARAAARLGARAPSLRLGVHTCASPVALRDTGCTIWHGDAERYESAWIDLALSAPAGVEVVWGVVPTDASDTDDDIDARIRRIEDATGKPVRCIAPACGLGTRTAETARAVLAQLERVRRG